MRLTFATRSKCSLRSPWGFLCFVGLVTCLSGSVVTSRCKYVIRGGLDNPSLPRECVPTQA